jgi:MFS superfamily sulfate permease-like transporter
MFAPIKKVVPETFREEVTLAVVIFPEVTLAVTMFAPIKKVVPETLRDTTLAWVVTLILRALIERTKAEPNWEPSWPRFDEPETFGKRFPDSTVDVLRTVRFPNSNVLPVVATSPKLVMTGILLFTEVFSSARVADHVVVLCPWEKLRENVGTRSGPS